VRWQRRRHEAAARCPARLPPAKLPRLAARRAAWPALVTQAGLQKRATRAQRPLCLRCCQGGARAAAVLGCSAGCSMQQLARYPVVQRDAQRQAALAQTVYDCRKSSSFAQPRLARRQGHQCCRQVVEQRLARLEAVLTLQGRHQQGQLGQLIAPAAWQLATRAFHVAQHLWRLAPVDMLRLAATAPGTTAGPGQCAQQRTT